MAFRAEPYTLPGFVGPANRLSSVNADTEDTINLFIESTPPGSGKVPKYLKNTACVRPAVSTGSGFVRGQFEQNGRGFAVSGTLFGEVTYDTGTATWMFTVYGLVANDGLPVSMCSNGSAGNQIFITSGGFGYIFNLQTNTLAIITDADFPADALMGEFIDGYFLVLVKNSRRFQISALEDGTSWDPLDVAERSRASDNIALMIRVNTIIWFVGTQTSEPWYDNGDPLFPFAPTGGELMEQGAVAAFGAARLDNAFAWLGLDTRGQGVVYRLNGLTPERVSTYAVESDLQTVSDLSSTKCFAQQQDGHLFFWVVCDALPWSWVLDITENLWHKRAVWDPNTCTYHPYLAGSHMFLSGTHLVGGLTTPTIYELSSSLFEDRIV
jgi:hypothetical protein